MLPKMCVFFPFDIPWGYFTLLWLVFHKLLESGGCFTLEMDSDIHHSDVCDSLDHKHW